MLLVSMWRPDCFPWGKPAITSYWGGNSILRIAWSSIDPNAALDTFPSPTQFKWFSAPIFSLWGMKESNRLPVWSINDCLVSWWYQYMLSPARMMTYTLTGESILWLPAIPEVCTTAYPSEWTYGISGKCAFPTASPWITPRYTCISNLISTGVTMNFASSVLDYQTASPCVKGNLSLDGVIILSKNSSCSSTTVDESGALMIVDSTQYHDEIYHTIPSLFKHVSPTDEEINAAKMNTVTPSIPVDMVRYVEFITPKWNIARITYPNFSNSMNRYTISSKLAKESCW